MLGEALAFPRQNDDWVRNVLIGGVLVVVSFLFFPVLLVYGYLARVLRASSNGVETAPEFDEWGDLFLEGAKLFGVALVYMLVPVVVAVFLAAFVGVLTVDLESGGGSAGVLGILAGLVILVVWVLAIYLLPAGMANMARERSFGAAFDSNVLRTAGGSADYFVAVLVAMVVGVVLGVVAALLTVVLVGVFVSFYVQVVVFYLLGRGFGDAVGTTGHDPETAAVESTESTDLADPE